MRKILIHIGLLFVAFGSSIYAQTNEAITVNQGELYILPNSVVSTHFDFVNTANGVLINDGKFEINQDYENLGLIGFTPNRTSGMTVFKGNAHLATGDSTSFFQNFEIHFVEQIFCATRITFS